MHVIGATVTCHDCACAYRTEPGLISLSVIRSQTEPQDWSTAFGLLLFTPKTHRLAELRLSLVEEHRGAARAIARLLRMPTPPSNGQIRDFEPDQVEPIGSTKLHVAPEDSLP